jgi:trans-2,3-dihydro-3-hydroxyanthranilate isomerase
MLLAMRTLAYRLCDVFTAQPFAGNALAVFLEADDVDPRLMQTLARELNLSECAFVLTPRADSREQERIDARLRIFTPTMELPFAGHPTLGTAFVLAEPAPGGEATIRLQTERGVSTVRLTRPDSAPAFGWMTQPLPSIRSYELERELLSALGVAAALSPIELYDNGPHYVLVELDTPERVASLRPDLGALAALGSLAVTTFARAGAGWKTRVFAPGEGIAEDPATGAAAGPTALHLARQGRIRFGETVTIAQGLEVGRPSTLYARVNGSVERVEQVEVGGHAVVVGRGELEVRE